MTNKAKAVKKVKTETSAKTDKITKVGAEVAEVRVSNTKPEAQDDALVKEETKTDTLHPEEISVDLETTTDTQNKEGGVEEVEGIIVENPLELRPKSLPFIVKPKNGTWKNEAQAEYAGFLNGYAYTNPTKWEKKKGTLLKKLVKIGEEPELVNLYKGTPESGDAEKLTYTNNLLSQ